MAKEENVLLAQIAALYRNLERVHALLSNQEVQSRAPVSGKFHRVINPYKTRLEDLKKRVEGNTLTPVQLQEAWNDCRSIKQKAQQIFNQCLDYIGGIAIRKWKLEEDICDLAESLVGQNFRRGASWLSVTIVGEDRLFDEVAQTTQIIRLRFPEWDIWSLPFTAYEFGRWMAGENYVEGLSQFYTDEKGRILRLITSSDDIALIAAGDITEEGIKDLAPQIKDLREGFQNHKKTAKEIGGMVDQQEAQMRELFADAFATYFLGPAYPYARVCLRLDPTEALQNGPDELLPVRRMDLVLRLLTEMNDLAKAKKADQYEDGPYKSEHQRLKALWEKTIQALQPGYNAELHFGQPYDRWPKALYDMLKETYGDEGFTDKDWNAALALSKLFLDGEGGDKTATDIRMSLPIILNAAWHCRVHNADRIDAIEKQARRAMLAVSETESGVAQAGGKSPFGIQAFQGDKR